MYALIVYALSFWISSQLEQSLAVDLEIINIPQSKQLIILIANHSPICSIASAIEFEVYLFV
jgi:hypothetical protein